MRHDIDANFRRSAVADRLASRFDREYGVLTGRATTGLTLVFRALSARHVLYPAYVCPSPLYAADYAGATLSFYDVVPGNPDVSIRVPSMGLDTRDIDVVVVTHPLGCTANVDRARKIADRHDAILIEDAALSIGGNRDGTRVGAMGRATILSFREKKPLGLGTGGAVLTDDPTLANAVKERTKNLPAPDPDRLETSRQRLYDTYSTIRSLPSELETTVTLLNRIPAAFQNFYMHDFPRWMGGDLSTAVANLDTRRRRLRRHQNRYASTVAETEYDVLSTDQTRCPAVFPVLTPQSVDRASLLDRLHDRGFDAWALTERVYRRYENADYPGAETLYNGALSLPVGPPHDAADIDTCCRLLSTANERETE